MSPVWVAAARASLATALASEALRLISPMLSRSSLTPRATLAVFSLRRLPALLTVPAWVADPSALDDIVRLTEVNSSAALASWVAVVFTCERMPAMRSLVSRCWFSMFTWSVTSIQLVIVPMRLPSSSFTSSTIRSIHSLPSCRRAWCGRSFWMIRSSWAGSWWSADSFEPTTSSAFTGSASPSLWARSTNAGLMYCTTSSTSANTMPVGEFFTIALARSASTFSSMNWVIIFRKRRPTHRNVSSAAPNTMYSWRVDDAFVSWASARFCRLRSPNMVFSASSVFASAPKSPWNSA